jgi:hypothetical protein
MPTDRVHIIWDNSNIFISGRHYCDQIEQQGRDFRIHFENLIDMSANGRQIEQVFCIGSVPPPTESVWGHIEKKTGKKPELYERGADSGKEQAIDQALQTRMLRLGYDYNPPETIVLLSGDGSGYEEGVGFFSDIKRLHQVGWKIEVVSWKQNTKQVMRKWAEENGIFIPLEDFYGSITFIQKKRNGKPVDYDKRNTYVIAS